MILVHLASMLGFVVVTLAVQSTSHFAINKAHYKSIGHIRPDPIVPFGLTNAALQGLLMSLAMAFIWDGSPPARN